MVLWRENMRRTNEYVIGKDLESHIALLLCQHNAKKMTAEEFVQTAKSVIGKKKFLATWKVYQKQTQYHRALHERQVKALAKQRKEDQALANEFIILPVTPSMKEHIRKEMRKR